MLDRNCFHPTSKEEFEQDLELLKEREDTIKSLNNPAYNTSYALLKFVYSSYHDNLFVILGDISAVKIGKLKDDHGILLNKNSIVDLYKEYQTTFLQANNPTVLLENTKSGYHYFKTWLKLYSIFLKCLIRIQIGFPFKEVLYSFKICLNEEEIYLNLGLSYDLSFRFGNMEVNSGLYFTHISEGSFVEYMYKMNMLSFPLANKITLLYGLQRLDANRTQTKYSSKTLAREAILGKIINLLQLQGGAYIELKGLETFKELISKNNQKNVLQLFAHFHDEIIHTQDDDYIFLSDLIKLINNQKKLNDINDDLIIDAITCDNYSDFQQIKKAGVKYVYFSNHYISTDWALLILLELYSGEAAKELGWKFPYLDGTTHLHIAYSNIIRAYFILMNKNNTIKLKLKDIMEKEIIVQGTNLQPFLKYLKQQKEEQENQALNSNFEFKGKFEKNNETLGTDLIGVFLSGIGSALIQLFINFSFRGLNNDVSIKFTDKHGREITISSKNKTDAEIIDLLKSVGIE